MMGAFNLLPSWGDTKEKQTLQLLHQEMGVVYGAVHELEGVFDALETGDQKKLEEKISAVDALEHRADEIRREVEENLFSGAFLPASRPQIIDFAEKMDGIADCAQDVARMTRFIKKEKMLPEHEELLKGILESTLACVKALMNAVESIDDLDRAKGYITDVRKHEHDVDELEAKAYRLIYESDYPPKCIIVYATLQEFLGAISNKAEDTSDTLSLLLLAQKL